MNITITIENPSSAVLKALGKAVPDDVANLKGLAEIIHHFAGHEDTTGHDEPSIGTPSFSVGDQVHWVGQRFNFEGVVEKVDLDALASGDDNDKAIYVRRGDNGKLVSLTNADIDTGGLTHI
jgi:hypothetical protein